MDLRICLEQVYRLLLGNPKECRKNSCFKPLTHNVYCVGVWCKQYKGGESPCDSVCTALPPPTLSLSQLVFFVHSIYPREVGFRDVTHFATAILSLGGNPISCFCFARNSSLNNIIVNLFLTFYLLINLLISLKVYIFDDKIKCMYSIRLKVLLLFILCSRTEVN